MLYYILIFVAVVMFGFQFYYNGRYQENVGSSLKASMVFALGSALTGGIVLLAMNAFHVAATWFTALMALAAAVNSLLFTFCSIRALERANLSLFSVFSMIGGMILPFVVGIVCYSEGLTIAKVICLILVSIGMFFTVRPGEGKGGFLYYAGIFIFNGMSGVISLIFNRADFPKAAAADYSILSAGFRILLAVIVLAILTARMKQSAVSADSFPKKLTFRGVLLPLIICGVLGTVANYMLLIALEHVPGSMQYPLVTGGVMIASTALGFFTAHHPGKRDFLAVGFCFAGMLALLLPI